MSRPSTPTRENGRNVDTTNNHQLITPVSVPSKKVVTLKEDELQTIIRNGKLNSIFDLQEPKTPENKIDNEQDLQQVSPTSESESDTGNELVNPFIESDYDNKESNLKFNEDTKENKSHKSEIDYSKNMELYNHRTGKRTIRQLTSKESSIKPKRLNFSERDS